MKPKGIIKRFLVPLILVVGIREVSCLTYNAASALFPGILWECCREPEIYDLRKDPRKLKSLFLTTAGLSLSEKLTPQLDHIKREHGLKNSDDFF